MRYLIIFTFLILTPNISNAWFWGPTVGGCVYQEHNKEKIKCVSYPYNENKDPGSLKKAERRCYETLNHYGRKYGEHGYWIDGCVSSAGAY